jgi:predicted esterase
LDFVFPPAALAPSLVRSTAVDPPAISVQDQLIELRAARQALLAQKPVPAPAPSPTPTPPKVSATALDLYVHLPPGAALHQPLRVLLVLHGMGGHGEKFASSFIADAERNNWVLVAPTLPYSRDYMDPNQLRVEDLQLGHALHSALDELPGRLGLKLRRHALIFGFSRGAQLAHRFAFFHPDHVETIAAVAAGSYTMPEMNNASAGKSILAFPYGVGDLQQQMGESVNWSTFKKISFWVAVGEKDNRPNEVPRAFDPYGGKTRLERARSFEAALVALGMDAHLVVFANTDHEVTAEMRKQAIQFMCDDERSDNWND